MFYQVGNGGDREGRRNPVSSKFKLEKREGDDFPPEEEKIR
jgi:hypothetical protein